LIFFISAYFAFLKFKDNVINVAFLFVVVGIIFNPFIPIEFEDDETVTLIVFLAAIFFGYLGYKEYQKISAKDLFVSYWNRFRLRPMSKKFRWKDFVLAVAAIIFVPLLIMIVAILFS